jgi:hypothetical protein
MKVLALSASKVPCGSGSSIISPNTGTSSNTWFSKVHEVVISTNRPIAKERPPAMEVTTMTNRTMK